MESFEVNRTVTRGQQPLSQLFRGLEDSQVVQKIFGGKESAAEAIQRTVVKLDDSAEYMYVDDSSGTIIVSPKYLQSADKKLLYLDVVHELVHVRQYKEGRDLFDSKYTYVDRPTELEAYRVTLDEARRIGMTEDEIEEYLYVEWITKKEHQKLAEVLGVNGSKRRTRKTT